MLQGIQSDSESGGIGRYLKVVDEAQWAKLADVQDCGGGELGVSFGWGDDAVELWMLVDVDFLGRDMGSGDSVPLSRWKW
jgi:hypothetical protein